MSSKKHSKEQVIKSTLIQNRMLSSADLKAIKRLSAAHTATSSRSGKAIGLAPSFNSLMKNSLNVWVQRKSKIQIVISHCIQRTRLITINKNRCKLQFTCYFFVSGNRGFIYEKESSAFSILIFHIFFNNSIIYFYNKLSTESIIASKCTILCSSFWMVVIEVMQDSGQELGAAIKHNW